ncbi:NAD-dependent epimerase/dehydratase family protein [Solibacillus sp. MA9]|uniref:NAD-dependent epimerase/dehydratase family protein n=1 Tax=Solibacillus palustris TaxID=2908203 RepID=A0ABS9U8E3_9BACL|nr:NAD-dependent epimerase/dehydratase family protein [Solibacillus sp. MA9]MCH7320613.1 NAD-dependent epimerase/dehydratase family protein [Solibacillus sp. MA9]
MKVLIIGKNGYVAQKLVKACKNNPLITDTVAVSVRQGIKDIEFNHFDVCIHTAALVHKKESHYQKADYFKVNTDLTIEIAENAKSQGVKHFIFLSTMAVYGQQRGEINGHSSLKPITFYGESKLAAEQALQALQDEYFTVSIVRPPMIYGPNCPGNYALLRKLAKKTPIFPSIENERSMLFIDHLCEFINQLILSKDAGIFHPQDGAFMNTSQMVLMISKHNNHRIFLSKMGRALITKTLSNVSLMNKVFGNLTYAQNISQYNGNSYQKFNLAEAIELTERQWKEDVK